MVFKEYLFAFGPTICIHSVLFYFIYNLAPALE